MALVICPLGKIKRIRRTRYDPGQLFSDSALAQRPAYRPGKAVRWGLVLRGLMAGLGSACCVLACAGGAWARKSSLPGRLAGQLWLSPSGLEAVIDCTNERRPYTPVLSGVVWRA